MNIKKVNLAIFASGNGTNAEAIMDHFKDDSTISVALVLSNNPTAGVLARAHRLHSQRKLDTKFYDHF